MPHHVLDQEGHTVELPTMEDLKSCMGDALESHGNAMAAKVLRWLLGGGIGIVAAAVMLYARMDNRVTNVEKDGARTVADRAHDASELRSVIRKVDSLTYVIGTQTEILQRLDRRLR